ncbi:tyrosine--tRNA ligase [Picrophilus oshimae]|uniref:Tyrosine--tRNA ligase n=1 Tax=Picrophilus torridus (strain ATCC 700027 / DSM 9790 / JCM 10055 / NBRC 100828 / KAW 2/3) TaxID=1122961 RepID=A0A8G2L7Y4_PICTO|nr:tyrosine--tRNA ligase [Picrophilus oshimae]SMD31572.1 tyrosyl-tRNA synthetase [Picrophilus oshimae DSM 9789]
MDAIDFVKKNTEEIVTMDEAFKALNNNPKGYIGFEPSGNPHLGTCLLLANKINDMVNAGIKMTVLLADWHAMVNDKLNGDLNEIRKSGELFKRAWLAAGLNSNVKFVWASELVEKSDYWSLLLKVAKNASLLRIRRSLPIMGRSEEDADRDFSKYIYPLMQVTDIFYLDVDFALGGMDQRHAHMLARDIAERMNIKKPVSVHTPLLSSLKGSGRMDSFKKMSKSEPDSAIFMTDSNDDIKRKIKNAYCPMKEVNGNPVIDILKYIIFPYYNDRISIKRPESKGGPVDVDMDSLTRMYISGEIHPVDLKNAVGELLCDIIGPVREKLTGD